MATLRQEIGIDINGVSLTGDLTIPRNAAAAILFAHGSGSSRQSPRNKYVAGVLNESGLATLLIDLLTPEEEMRDAFSGEYRFNIEMLAGRLIVATDWLAEDDRTKGLKIGYFGASTGAAAAILAATERPDKIYAIVSRGGRPDMAAAAALSITLAPTLLIVGGNDDVVIALNKEAAGKISAEKSLQVIPGATHLFEEPGALEKVAGLAGAWFVNHLSGPS